MAVVAVCWLLAQGVLRADTPPAMDGVAMERDGDHFVVSGRLEGGLTPEMLEEIGAGLETSVDYRVNVYRQRSGLPNEAIVKRRIECSVRYDALTRQYTLTRKVDGDTLDSRVTTEMPVMKQFLTTLDGVAILPVAGLLADEQYYAKVKAELGIVWRFYLIPWPLDTAWVRVPIHLSEDAARDPEP
jgi:Domain of unknown function (DUF4390)